MSRFILQKHTARLMVVLLCLVLILSAAPVAHASESGSCGADLTWTLSEGVLTIEGSGAMTNFPESDMAPWYPLRGEIRKVALPAGLTRIGNLAFYDCYRLTAVDIPNSVTSIGEFAFASCEKLQLLDFGNNMLSIANDAFHGCWDLSSVVLPQSLLSIGSQAFYDCASLTSIMIPAGVQNLGTAVFAYCTSLIRAEVQTQLNMLPDWTFFGCSQLNMLILPDSVEEIGNAALRDCTDLSTVSYGGSSMTKDQLEDVISKDVPGFDAIGNVTTDAPGGSAVGGNAMENADGTVSEKITTVTPGENSTVSSTIDKTFIPDAGIIVPSDNPVPSDATKSTGPTVSSDIIVTVENDDGWKEAQEGVQSALTDLANRNQPGTTTETSNVTVYIKDSDTLDGEFLESLVGRDVIVNVVTKDGSSWKIDCNTLVEEDLSGAYDLRYTIEPADEDALALMGVLQGYRIRFAENALVNAEVMILLPDSAIRQTATLFQKESAKELTRFQSVIVDGEGYAHLHLGSVDKKTDYYLGINVPEAKAEAIIPEVMENEYAPLTYQEPIRYEITGRTSSWGMGLGKVMGILAGVMIGVVVLVGVIMYLWNKQRLKAGYVPQWDDDDDYK